MSDYGVFEATSTDGHEEEQRQRQAKRDLGGAIEAAREGFGDFLGSSTDKQDYNDRLALVMNDLMQKVADSGVLPVPGVMRKVKAALRPEFRKQAAPGFDPNISDENLLAGLQIAEALNHDGSNQAKVDELRAEVNARGLTPLKASRKHTAETFQPGDKVMKSGYPGTVQNEYMDGMYEVKMERGTVVVPAEELTRVSSRKQADDHLDAPGVDMSQLRLDGLGNYGDAVAVVFDDSGNAVDLALNWETAQSMAQEGYDVQVVRGDGGRSQDEIQRMVDHEKELRRDLFGSRKTASRSLSEIAAEIRADWKNVYFGAEPYLDAMSSLDSINDSYGQDSASSIVAYFLSNATSWRGETARRVKKELKELSKRRAHKQADYWDDNPGFKQDILDILDQHRTDTAPKIAPHPDYGEGVWSDEGIKQRVLSLDPNLPTPELVGAIMKVMDQYGYDSMDRELAFWHFSQVTGKDYDDFYNAWMNIPGDKYFSSRQAAEYDPRIVALSDEELERLLKENPDHEGLQDEAYTRGLDKVDYFAKRKQAGSAQVLQKLENALNDQRSVDVICSNSPDGSFSSEREIPVDEGLQKVRGWVSAGDLVDTAQGGNFFDFEHRASGENVNFYITQEY